MRYRGLMVRIPKVVCQVSRGGPSVKPEIRSMGFVPDPSTPGRELRDSIVRGPHADEDECEVGILDGDTCTGVGRSERSP